MHMGRSTPGKILRTALVALILIPLGAGVAQSADRTFTVVNIDYEGTKVWVPATLVVEEGDTVQIKLINNVPGGVNQHGFSIAAFDVAAVVTRGEPETVKFTASKSGIFPINCQLHPAHIGGQLVVLDD